MAAIGGCPLAAIVAAVVLMSGSGGELHPALLDPDDPDADPAESLVVSTHSGQVRGYRQHVMGEELHVFLGIPYAKPPLGELRFRRSEPVEPWTGIRDALRPPNSCMQERTEYFPGFRGEEMWNPNTNISEDCLYLNLWVPASVRRNVASPSSVMVWIYGGSYMSGTSTLQVYDGSILAVMNEVIVASFNYRVGVFGFLYFGIDEAPGNMGLYDQKTAFEWLRTNVGQFGGDPDQLTLFGESAGAGSIAVHLLSPVTNHLFSRAIMQSGSVNAPWSHTTAEAARATSASLANLLGCNTSSPHDVHEAEWAVNCMLDLPASTLSDGQWSIYTGFLSFPFCPTVDGYFLPKSPHQLLKEGKFRQETSVLLGSNLNEGTYFILYDFMSYFHRDKPSELTRPEVMDIISAVFKNFTRVEREAVSFQYTDWESPGDDGGVNGDLVGDMVGDYFFVCPINHFAQAFAAKGVPVYYYYFTQRTSVSPWGAWMGVLHGDEIEYVFGTPLNHSHNFTQPERELSRRIMHHFSNFAKNGDPSTTDIEWPRYSKAEPAYVIFDGIKRGRGRGPRTRQCAFWNEFMPILFQNRNTHTHNPELSQCKEMVHTLQANGINKERLVVLQLFGATMFVLTIANSISLFS